MCDIFAKKSRSPICTRFSETVFIRLLLSRSLVRKRTKFQVLTLEYFAWTIFGRFAEYSPHFKNVFIACHSCWSCRPYITFAALAHIANLPHKNVVTPGYSPLGGKLVSRSSSLVTFRSVMARSFLLATLCLSVVVISNGLPVDNETDTALPLAEGIKLAHSHHQQWLNFFFQSDLRMPQNQ